MREEDGSPVGLYLLDLYTRDSKNGGAWMNSLVDQSTLLDMPTAVVVNNLNVSKPAAGEPDSAHARRGRQRCSTSSATPSTDCWPASRTRKLAGTNVSRDFVEFPSQVNEMWMLWPEVLANYAVHVETGEPLPTAVVERLKAADTFNEGFSTTEYLAATLLDLAWHRTGSGRRRSTT